MAPKFSLQPVLDYRHSRVEALEIQLAELLGYLQQHRDILQKLQTLEMSLLDDLSVNQKGDIDLFVVQHTRANIHLVQEKISLVKKKISELEKSVAAKQQEIILAKQGEETLKTLKDKEVQRYVEEQARIESSQIDDVYIAQAFRNQQSGGTYL